MTKDMEKEKDSKALAKAKDTTQEEWEKEEQLGGVTHQQEKDSEKETKKDMDNGEKVKDKEKEQHALNAERKDTEPSSAPRQWNSGIVEDAENKDIC